MKKIITAMGDKRLNQKLKQEEAFEVVAEDIPYTEGIIEILEKKQADILILNGLLSDETKLKELIGRVKEIHPNIQIILFLEKQNKELEKDLYAKGVYSIFYDNQIEFSELIRWMKEELNEIKPLLRESANEAHQIICVSGTNGIGKSMVCINLAKAFMQSKNKILIIDFDVLNHSLHTILGIKRYPEKVANKIKNNNLLEPLQVEELIMKINSKIDLIAGISLLFDNRYQISKVKIKTILAKLKEIYDVIIIDTTSECFLDYTMELMKNSHIDIFMLEPNLLEIKKAKRLLNIYINEWKVPQTKFKILFNKCNENSIDNAILKNIFDDFTILGQLQNHSQYHLLINKNDTGPLKGELQKEYFSIFQKLFQKEEKIKK